MEYHRADKTVQLRSERVYTNVTENRTIADKTEQLRSAKVDKLHKADKIEQLRSAKSLLPSRNITEQTRLDSFDRQKSTVTT